MGISSGATISGQAHSLPSPARGSPPGASPDKNIAPELTGLERMVNGWRRDAATKKRKSPNVSSTKKEKEQRDVNDLRARIIENRMKKLEQQSTSKVGVKNNCIPGEGSVDLNRKRRYEDESYGTPSESGFSCESPDACHYSPKAPLPTTKHTKTPPSANVDNPPEKHGRYVIETFQLPSQHMPIHVPQPAINARSNPILSNFSYEHSTSTSNGSFPADSASFDDLNARATSQRSFMAPNSMMDISSSIDVRVEEMVRNMPSNMDALAAPEYLQAVNCLGMTTTAQNATYPTQTKRSTNADAQFRNQQEPTYDYTLTNGGNNGASVPQQQQMHQQQKMQNSNACPARPTQQLEPPPPYSIGSTGTSFSHTAVQTRQFQQQASFYPQQNPAVPWSQFPQPYQQQHQQYPYPNCHQESIYKQASNVGQSQYVQNVQWSNMYTQCQSGDGSVSVPAPGMPAVPRNDSSYYPAPSQAHANNAMALNFDQQQQMAAYGSNGLLMPQYQSPVDGRAFPQKGNGSASQQKYDNYGKSANVNVSYSQPALDPRAMQWQWPGN